LSKHETDGSNNAIGQQTASYNTHAQFHTSAAKVNAKKSLTVRQSPSKGKFQ